MLGDRLTELRVSRQLTQEELARYLNMSRSTYAQYEVGRRNPDYETLEKIADYFNVSTDYLLCRTDDPHPIEYHNELNKKRIEEALLEDPESEELLTFWRELKEREDLKLLFKQVRPLSSESIRRIVKIIKVIEDEEAIMEP